ncbi:cytochrome b [Viridibacterium curvum]|uniref:Cytochrome b n=1 Tax=Viridibacterium curvum TaxID=1101404 RepID=A0ABP9QJL8_9RHOO
MSSSSVASYTRIAISLHWLMALAIIGAFCVGLYMVDLPFSPQKLQIYSWHKWAGVSIFALALIRIVWRLTHRPPEPPDHMPRWQRAVAEVTHNLLYVLMLAIPFSGWLMSSAKGVPTVWFGVLPLPDLLVRDVELGKQLASVHAALNYTLAALVLAHVGAALKHHLIERDTVLVRMLPLLRQR